MVLGDLSLWKLLNDLVRDPEPDPDMVNPASIDVRVGREMLVEVGPGQFKTVDLTTGPGDLRPGDFALVPTLEWLTVPNGYAVELKLNNSGAGHGFDPSMGTWLDPGWCGVATMAIRNATRHTPLRLQCGMRIAQLVVHQLDQPAVRLHRERGGGAPSGAREGPMTAMTTARGPLAVDPDHYLDCRQPGWESYEDRGLIRFERPLGSRTALVFVDNDCIDVVATLQVPAHRRRVPSQ